MKSLNFKFVSTAIAYSFITQAQAEIKPFVGASINGANNSYKLEKANLPRELNIELNRLQTQQDLYIRLLKKNQQAISNAINTKESSLRDLTRLSNSLSSLENALKDNPFNGIGDNSSLSSAEIGVKYIESIRTVWDLVRPPELSNILREYIVFKDGKPEYRLEVSNMPNSPQRIEKDLLIITDFLIKSKFKEDQVTEMKNILELFILQGEKERTDLSINTFNSIINNITNEINKLEEDKERYSAFLESYTKEIEPYREFEALETKASETQGSISLMTGFKYDASNFGFITELGLDFNLGGKIGDNSKKEIEMKNTYNAYLTQKLGYYFASNNLTYITAGLGFKNYKFEYNSDSLNINNKFNNKLHYILGVGNEFAINKQISAFVEFNSIFSANKIGLTSNKIKNIGDVKTSSQQVRIGVRYYGF
jgi:opacity protein-like surface antigen